MKPIRQGFYDDPLNEKLKVRTRELLTSCCVDFAQIFNEAQKLTFEDAKRKPSHYKRRNFMAENMYGNIIGLLVDNYQSLIEEDAHKRPFIRLDKDVIIYIKKLTPKTYIPNNIITEHVKELKYQELFEDAARINVLFAGFVLKNEDWFVPFENVCIAYLNRFYTHQAAWIIDLKDYPKSGTIISPLVPVEPDAPLVTVPDTIITLPKASNE